MARCLDNEKHMRLVFYGAMIAEGFIALVWATAAQGYYQSPQALAAVLAMVGPGQVVHDISISTMGSWGALALIGVVILPITSGDTAFHAARLIMAEYFKLPQTNIINRYIVLPFYLFYLLLF